MLINVTARDIKFGIAVHGSRCPIARAIRRHFPKTDIAVSQTRFWVGSTPHHLPEAATRFIRDFDHGWEVSPFQFTVDEQG